MDDKKAKKIRKKKAVAEGRVVRSTRGGGQWTVGTVVFHGVLAYCARLYGTHEKSYDFTVQYCPLSRRCLL